MFFAIAEADESMTILILVLGCFGGIPLIPDFRYHLLTLLGISGDGPSPDGSGNDPLRFGAHPPSPARRPQASRPPHKKQYICQPIVSRTCGQTKSSSQKGIPTTRSPLRVSPLRAPHRKTTQTSTTKAAAGWTTLKNSLYAYYL